MTTCSTSRGPARAAQRHSQVSQSAHRITVEPTTSRPVILLNNSTP